MIALRKIDGYNFRKVIELKVAPEQEDYLTTNEYSLAQAFAMPECRPLAVYDGMTPVGFVMYALDEDDREYWIYRLMTDARFQKRGIGRQALRLAIDEIRKEGGAGRPIFLSFEPDNEVAKRFYMSEGFRPDGRVIDGEIVLRLDPEDKA